MFIEVIHELHTKSKSHISLRDSGSIPDVGSSKISIYNQIIKVIDTYI